MPCSPGRSGGCSPLCWCLFRAAGRSAWCWASIYLVRRQCAGTGVGRFPLQPLCPAGDGRRVAGLPADRLCRYLLPVPLPPAGLCHALPGAAGAALLRHPPQGEYFGIFAAALWVFSFLSMGMLGKLNYLLCMLGFLLFFGPQAGITSALGAPGAVEEEKSALNPSVALTHASSPSRGALGSKAGVCVDA